MEKSDAIISKIRNIRIEKNLTQEQMASILGLNRVTYINIESGKRRLNIDEFISICRALDITISAPSIASTEENIRSFNKLRQVYYYILQNYFQRDGVPKTKLAKLLYLSDFTYYYRFHESITGSKYIRLAYGPVAERFFFLTDMLFDKGKINIRILDSAQMISISSTANDVDPNALSSKEKQVISEVCDYWKDKRTSEIVNFTHSQKPWKTCKDGESIPYELILEEPADHILCPSA